jgi:hypothetical protein
MMETLEASSLHGWFSDFVTALHACAAPLRTVQPAATLVPFQPRHEEMTAIHRG